MHVFAVITAFFTAFAAAQGPSTEKIQTKDFVLRKDTSDGKTAIEDTTKSVSFTLSGDDAKDIRYTDVANCGDSKYRIGVQKAPTGMSSRLLYITRRALGKWRLL